LNHRVGSRNLRYVRNDAVRAAQFLRSQYLSRINSPMEA
jgi:hypothetical protein